MFVYDAFMDDTDIAASAALFGDPARARMLLALMGGCERPASELAGMAHVTPQTASAHLAKLQAGGLVVVQRRGRHRYYRLAGADVASAIEALQNLSERTTGTLHEPTGCTLKDGFRFARTCYDHLAGRVAVVLTDALLEHGHLQEGEKSFSVTPSGTATLARFGIDVDALARGRRVLAKPCPDWTERRPHLGGALGSALAQQLLARRWVLRLEQTRALHLTASGLEGLEKAFGVRL